MREIDANSAEDYLRETSRVSPGAKLQIRELTGGVSNIVLLVESTDGEAFAPFVLKQARAQLRVAQPWFCSVERIWREVAVLRICGRVLASQPHDHDPRDQSRLTADVPDVLFEDRENFLYAMSAAPPHTVWKTQLLAGDVREQLAAACGRLLGVLHAGTWHDAETARELDDRRFFIALRVDPYYRRVAEVHSQLRDRLEALIAGQESQRHCLVHGDFSPKNLLVHDQGLTLVDFEVGHYGDPAFDLGFFLSHLVLKAIHAHSRGEDYLALTEVFWTEYRRSFQQTSLAEQLAPLERRAILNFAACALSRVDGKSPVEYLVDETLRDQVRMLTTRLLDEPPENWRGVLALVRRLGATGEPSAGE